MVLYVREESDLHPGERGMGDPGVRMSWAGRPRCGVPGDRGMWYLEDEDADMVARDRGGVLGAVARRRGVSGGVETIVGPRLSVRTSTEGGRCRSL